MRRSGALVILVVASAALAEWTPFSVNGTPYDVEIRDAGHFAIALKPGASPAALEVVHVPDAGTSTGMTRNVSNAVSAYLDGRSGCLTAVDDTGAYQGCPESYPLPATLDTSIRVRHTQGGSAYATGCQFSRPYFAYAANPAVSSPYPYTEFAPSFVPRPPLCPSALSVLQVGTASYALFGLAGPTSDLLLAVDGGAVAPYFDGTVTSVNEVALFTADGELRALVAGPNGLKLAVFNGDGGYALSSVSLEPGNVTGAAFATGTGDPLRGDGFGMVISQTDAGFGPGGVDAGIYSAIPNPRLAGTRWVRNTRAPPALAGPVERVMCLGAQFCVLLTGQGTVNNVLLYDNRFPPSFPQPQPLTELDEGAAGNVTVTVIDDDGDAVYVTWDAGAGDPVSVGSSSEDGRTVQISTTAGSPLLCGAPYTDFQITAYAADGWAPHLRSEKLIVRLNHVVSPGEPGIDPPSQTAGAGTGPVVFTATPPSSGCASTIAWSEVGDAGFAFAADGGHLVVTPPATYCAAGGGTATYAARAVEVGTSGLTSAPVTATLTVLPWGIPDAPFPPGQVFVQDAGTRQSYSSSATHACATAPGFPGVITTWTLDAGVTGASLWESGAPAGSGPVSGASVELAVPACVGGAVELTALNRVNPSGPDGPPEALAVLIQDVREPIQSAGFTLDGGYNASDATLRGLADSSANCARERDLGAVLSLARADGGVIESGRFAVPGPWSFPVPSGCAGGSFVVSGYLVEDGGTSGSSAALAMDVPALPAGIAAVAPDVLTASCTRGARGTLAASLGAGSCPTATLTWRQTGGPAVRITPGPGATEATVESVQTELVDLLGQEVSLQVTATTSVGSTATLDKTLRITADPFVVVRHRTDSPVASESGILGVAVQLANPEACGASQVTYREELEGLRYVPGTARIDGQPAGVTQDGDALVFEGLELPSGGTVELSYSARPRLLSRPQPAGQAFMNDVPISVRDALGGQAGGGCGCSGASGELSLIALGLVGWALRRRRAPKALQPR